MTAPLNAADLRSAEILGSIRRTFAEKGFDGASMQDLARAAGMSVGNFYRYFPSKAAMIEAIITRDLLEIEQDFSTILNSPDPMARLREKISQRIANDECPNDGSLWAEITAAALRKPEIASTVARMENEIQGYLTAVFARATGLGHPEAQERFGAHAALLMMMVTGSAIQRAEGRSDQTHLIALILRTIDRTLDEISQAAVKG